jgi:hypothetical protein
MRAIFLMATAVGLDRDRAFYPTVTIVIASYYALFAVLGASTQALVLESLVDSVFLAVAVWGFRSSLWLSWWRWRRTAFLISRTAGSYPIRACLGIPDLFEETHASPGTVRDSPRAVWQQCD